MIGRGPEELGMEIKLLNARAIGKAIVRHIDSLLVSITRKERQASFAITLRVVGIEVGLFQIRVVQKGRKFGGFRVRAFRDDINHTTNGSSAIER